MARRRDGTSPPRTRGRRDPDARPRRVRAPRRRHPRRRLRCVLNLSTGTAGGRSERDDRLAPLALNPEMASFDCGTINFGERIFEGDLPFLRRMAERFRETGAKPELECFDTGYTGI